MNKYSFFYDGGAEGGLSCIVFTEESLEEAWEKMQAMQENNTDLNVRLVIENLESDFIHFQE